MDRWTERRARLRAILAGDRCFHPASIFDPLSARIAQDVGYEMLMMGGSLAALSVLGAPDRGVITLSEFAGHVYRICRAVDLPLLVDADNGFGNALNVMRTVQELETAGLAAMTVEDSVQPPAYGAYEKEEMVSLEEGVAKMRAALSARCDPAMVIAARTSAIRIAGMEDAIRRAKAYEAAGVDAVFFTRVQSRDQVQAIAAELKISIFLGGPRSEDVVDLDFLGRNGVKVCLQGKQPFPSIAASVQGVYNALKALRGGARPDSLPNLAPVSLLNQITRDDDYERWVKDFLGG